MKRVSLGGLDVSRLGLGALGTSALAEKRTEAIMRSC